MEKEKYKAPSVLMFVSETGHSLCALSGEMSTQDSNYINGDWVEEE